MFNRNIKQTLQAMQELNKQWQQTYQNLHTMQLRQVLAETVAVNALNNVVDIEGRAESASKAAPAPACVPAAAAPAVATVQSQHQAAVHATHATSRHDVEDTTPPKKQLDSEGTGTVSHDEATDHRPRGHTVCLLSKCATQQQQQLHPKDAWHPPETDLLTLVDPDSAAEKSSDLSTM